MAETFPQPPPESSGETPENETTDNIKLLRLGRTVLELEQLWPGPIL